MRYFPISVDTQDKNILVLGGGSLATKKLEILLDTEFKIYCISDDFDERIIELKEEYDARLLLKGRTVTEDFVFFGYDYCVIATDDPKLNEALADRADKSNILYYRADNIGTSEFLFNDVIEHFGLAVSMLSPGLSKDIKSQIMTDIENVLFKYDIQKLTLLNQIKDQLVLKNYPDIKEELEMLSKKNVAMLKAYLETLQRTHPHLVKDFKENLNDNIDSYEKEESQEAEVEEIEDNTSEDIEE